MAPQRPKRTLTTAATDRLYFSVLANTADDTNPVTFMIAEDDVEGGFIAEISFPAAGASGEELSVSLTEPELRTLGRIIGQRFAENDPLVGRFAHTYKDGKIEKQAHVDGVVEAGYYLVTFFSWLDGEKNGSEIVKFTDMSDWRFYDEREKWQTIGDDFWRELRREQALQASGVAVLKVDSNPFES